MLEATEMQPSVLEKLTWWHTPKPQLFYPVWKSMERYKLLAGCNYTVMLGGSHVGLCRWRFCISVRRRPNWRLQGHR